MYRYFASLIFAFGSLVFASKFNQGTSYNSIVVMAFAAVAEVALWTWVRFPDGVEVGVTSTLYSHAKGYFSLQNKWIHLNVTFNDFNVLSGLVLVFLRT